MAYEETIYTLTVVLKNKTLKHLSTEYDSLREAYKEAAELEKLSNVFFVHVESKQVRNM